MANEKNAGSKIAYSIFFFFFFNLGKVISPSLDSVFKPVKQGK